MEKFLTIFSGFTGFLGFFMMNSPLIFVGVLSLIVGLKYNKDDIKFIGYWLTAISLGIILGQGIFL